MTSKPSSLSRLFLPATWLFAATCAWGFGCTPGDDTGGGVNDAGNDSGTDAGIDGGTDAGIDGGIDGGSGTGGRPQTECKTDPVTGEEVCTCFQVQTWGALGTYGAVPGNDGTDAISQWLNLNSSGEASYVLSKPVISADSLAPFKVLIIQDVSLWAPFTTEEIAAVEAWVQAGGGIISLNGYKAETTEVNNVNSLLAFTGMSYQAADTFTTAQRDALLGDCKNCYGYSAPQAGWSAHPIGANIANVGAFYGRPINPGSATVVANDGSAVYGAAGEYGSGRVFMFHDEWVTYNSQWTGAGVEFPCDVPEPEYPACVDETPQKNYTISQFWYNSLKWLANVECFDITAPGIVK